MKKIVLTGVEQNKKYQPGEVQNLSAQLPDTEIVKIKVLNGNTEFKNWEREGNGNVSVDLSELGRGKHTISVCAQNRMNYWYISKITFYIE